MTAKDLGERVQQTLDLASARDFGMPVGDVTDQLHEVYRAADREPVLRARVAAALGRVRAYADDATRGSAYADEAIRIAEDLDDAALLADALDARLTACSGPDDLVARLETSMWLLEVSGRIPSPDVRLHAHVWRLTTGLENLDLATTRRQLAALDLLADETRDDRARFVACSRRAMFALTEGDVVGAARLTAEATAAGVAAGVPETEAVQRALQAEMARQRDDRAGLARAAGLLEQRGGERALAEAAVLWLEGGEPDRARGIVDRLAPALADLPRNPDWLLVVGKTCEAAAGSGRAAAAAQCADLLEPYAGRAVLNSGAVAFAGVVEDYLALATGDVAQAERARAAYARIGADWWAHRGPLGRPTEHDTSSTGTRVLHLHPADEPGPTRRWCVGREGAIRMMPSMHGLEYLRLLLERPGVDVPVLELSAAAPRSGAQPERARSQVRQAIAAALARLELHDGEVAHELRATIRTGTTCRYEPDPFRRVEWRVHNGHPTVEPVVDL